MQIEHIGDATLYLADCMDVLPTLDKVDCVVTDPPYGIGQNAHRGRSRGRSASLKGKIPKPTNFGSFEWDNNPATPEQIELLLSAGLEVIIFGGNYFSLPPEPCWLIWDKENGSNNWADAELAWTNIGGSVRLIRHMWNGMLRASENQWQRVHPAQKPIVVMSWAINQCKQNPQTILDPFCGSGTTGVACANLGRKFIGIEIEEKYWQIACERITAAHAQGRLFA